MNLISKSRARRARREMLANQERVERINQQAKAEASGRAQGVASERARWTRVVRKERGVFYLQEPPKHPVVYIDRPQRIDNYSPMIRVCPVEVVAEKMAYKIAGDTEWDDMVLCWWQWRVMLP